MIDKMVSAPFFFIKKDETIFEQKIIKLKAAHEESEWWSDKNYHRPVVAAQVPEKFAAMKSTRK